MTDTGLAALRRLAEDGNEEAADRLAVLAGERGDVDELRHLVDAGSETAGTSSPSSPPAAGTSGRSTS